MDAKEGSFEKKKNPHYLLKSEKKSGPGSQVPKKMESRKSEEDPKALKSPVQMDVPGMKVFGT